MRLNKSISLLTAFGLITAFLYSSWLLGYIINPKIAFLGTASELAATNQPFRWIFIMADVLVAISIIAVVFISRLSNQKSPRGITAFSLVLFGVLTAITAMIWLPCTPSVMQCGGDYYESRYFLHSIFGMFASFFLLIAALSKALSANKSISSGKWERKIQYLIVVWGLFGLLDLVVSMHTGSTSFVGAIIQRLFLTGSAILIYFVIRTNKS